MKPLGSIHGQWFEFEDKSGVRYCQIDVIYPVSRRLFAVVEVKYTLVDRAYDQLLDLYGPVVEAAYNTRVGLVAVFKNTRQSDPIRTALSIEEACQWSVDTGEVGLLRWLGQPVTKEPNDRLSSILHSIEESQPRMSAGSVPHRLRT